MKKYQDILDAQNNFLTRRNDFLKINYSFFFKLVNELYGKAELPYDGMIKYKYGTNENINSVEEWLDLDDNGICSMRISLKITEVYHEVKFYTSKVGNDILLKVVIDSDYHEFSFDINKNEVSDLKFEDIIEFIIVTIISIYDQSLA